MENTGKVAAKRDYSYVFLYPQDKPESKALKGGSATHTAENIYHFDGEFIGFHPNDVGMEAIAEALLPMFV
jgi:hypothetical protein